jgi:hypothetical protein
MSRGLGDVYKRLGAASQRALGERRGVSYLIVISLGWGP